MKTNTLLNTWIKYPLFVLTLFAAACSDDDGTTFNPGKDGFFIVNEGGFGNGNASLSYFDKATLSVTNDLFINNTGKPLGDQAQSMTIHNNRGYIVVQNSAKIEVISTDDYSLVATIEEGLPSPRYFLAINDAKAYVSDWGADGVSGTIKVIDLETNAVTKSIETGTGTNQLVLVGDYVYAANSAGWGYNNTVVVIDKDTDEVVDSIEVGDNPSTIVVDEGNDVWVTGSGKTVYNADWSVNVEESTPAFLAKIETDDNSVDTKINAPSIGIGPSALNIDSNGETLVFIYNGGISTAVVSTLSSADEFTEIISSVANLYGIGLDQSTNQIILAIAPDFSNPGSIKRHELNGSFIDEYTVGIGPNGIAY